MATLALKAVDNPLEFGIVITREDGTVERFLEKPTWGQVFSDTINTGIFVLEPEIFDFIPEGRPVDFSGETFPAVLEAEKPLYGYVADGYWEDVGTLAAYLKSHQDILDERVQVQIEGFPLRPVCGWAKAPRSTPRCPSPDRPSSGTTASIGPGTRLGEYCTLGSNIRLGDNSSLQRSVVHDNAYLGSGVRIEGSCWAAGSDLRQGVRLEEGVVLGDECFVGEHAELTRASRSIRTRRSRRGPSSTPRSCGSHGGPGPSSAGTACRAGQHGHQPRAGRKGRHGVGTSLEKGATWRRPATPAGPPEAEAGDDGGLNATGVNVVDLEAATVPVTRFQVRSQQRRRGHGPPGPR